MKKLLTILLILYGFTAFSQSGGSDDFKKKSDLLVLDNAQENATFTYKYLVINETTLEVEYVANINSDETDPIVGAINGIIKANGAGTISLAVSDTDYDSAITNEGSLTVAAGAANTSIINSNTSGQTGVTISGSNTINVNESGNVITIESSLIQEVDNGAKTASFTHDATSASIGAYTLNTTSAVTISIHNLSSGHMGTLFVDIGASNPSAITVATYSDAGSTGLTEVPMSTIANLANKRTTITYTCANNGTVTDVTIQYGQEL